MLPNFLVNPNPEIYLTGRPLFLDVETTNIETGNPCNEANRLLLACWITADGERKSKWGAEYEQRELLQDIASHDFVVAHSAKFEAGWLYRCGQDLHDLQVYDTLLGEWVIAGNRQVDKSLDGTRLRYSGKHKHRVGHLIHSGVAPESVPKPWLEEYCFDDVEALREIFYPQLAVLKQQQQLHLVYTRNLMVPLLADLERRGLTLDKDRVYEEYERVLNEYNTREAELRELAGGINLRSRPQVAELLYDKLGFQELTDRRGNLLRTDGGARKTDASTIQLLKATTDKQRSFVQAYKSLAKCGALLSKSLNFFKEIVDNHDCTFQGIFNQGIAANHRLSSSGRPVLLRTEAVDPEAEGKPKKPKYLSAQLQNIPREYKRLFRAKQDGWLIGECDGGQLEFRAAAEMSGDPVACEEIANDVDVHTITKDRFAEYGEKISRQDAKPRTFKPMYGGNGTNKPEQQYCKFFKDKYRGIEEMQRGWTFEVLSTKQLRTPYGMIFYWPDTSMMKSGYITNTTQIYNLPVSGFATGEVIPVAMVYLWHRMRNLQSYLVSTIHDSAVGEIHPDEQDTFRELSATAFTKDVYFYFGVCYNRPFNHIPLSAGVKIGEHWSEGVEHTAKVFPNKPDEMIWKTKH